MKGLIFNSGIGKRMGEFTKSNHKSMAVLKNGETIFERQLRLLRQAGITEVVVTTGPHAEQLKAVAGKPIFSDMAFTFVPNPDYNSTNYIYSMYLAREHLNDDVLILHGDLVFNRRLLEKVLASPQKDLATVNKQKVLPEKDFKARVKGENIREVSIHIFDEDCFAFQPMYKLSRETFGKWLAKVEEFVAGKELTVYAENALNEIFYDLDIRAFPYENDYIDEIDNLEDLDRVCEEIRQFDFDEQIIISDPKGFEQIPKILSDNMAKKPMLVCDKFFPSLFLNDYIQSLDTEFTVFDGFSPNPTYEEVVAGVKAFHDNNCDFILAIGGGSCIDTAKNIKLFAKLDHSKNYLEQEYEYSDIKLAVFPTTAGTGSESTRFSVLYYEGEKKSVQHDCMVPDYVILEPKFLETLPDYQKKATLLDALCQCIEATWSVNTNGKCQQYAQKGIELILSNVEGYLQGDESTFLNMLLAANYGGKAINISQTTAAHAMSYKISSMFGVAHGHAVALCLPHVWQFMNEKVKADKSNSFETVKESFAIINNSFGCATTKESITKFKDLFAKMELKAPRLEHGEDIATLVNSVNVQRLSNNPVALTTEDLKRLYEKVF